MPTRIGRPSVQAFLRCTWDDRSGLGEVIVIAERDNARATIFERTCDLWCFSMHVHKGAERLSDYLLDPMAHGYVEELFEDS